MDNIDFQNFLDSYLTANVDLRISMTSGFIPMVAGAINKDGDEGVLYLGNHYKHRGRRQPVNFTIIGSRDGVLQSEAITTREPKFLTGFDYGDDKELIVLMNHNSTNKQFIARPFLGCAALLYW